MNKPVYTNESTLFAIALVISIVGWIILTVVTVGTLLVMIPIMYIVYLFAQSGLISYLKGNGVLVADGQFPDIQARVKSCAEITGLKVVPEVYIIHGNGVFNAFATKFLSTHYLVLLSDILDALEEHPEAISFYIGHEMGHIDRKHVFWQSILLPALILPLLGAAYSRAREYTADMYGALCCPPEAAQQGLVALAVGGKRYKTINIKSYLSQVNETSGFWMSFHELVGSYPWLTKRFLHISPDFSRAKVPLRNAFAYIPALLVPRLSLASLAVVYLLFIMLGAEAGLIAKFKQKALDRITKQGSIEQSAPVPEGAKAPAPPPQATIDAQGDNTSVDILLATAEAGDADAQFKLGYAYHTGNGVQKDDQQAIAWFRKAAAQENSWAQFNLGLAYHNGSGVEKDDKEAVKWYRLAADQGNHNAETYLGFAYLNGTGVGQDHEEGLKWIHKASNQTLGTIVPNVDASAGQSTPQPNPWPELIRAAAAGDLPKVTEQIEGGADINMKNPYGMTALMWAVATGKTDTVRYLLQKGADVNLQNKSGYTALTLARMHNRDDIIQLLEQAGAVSSPASQPAQPQQVQPSPLNVVQ